MHITVGLKGIVVFAAKLTSKWELSKMRPFVGFKVAALFKAFSAELATIRTFVSMDTFVNSQM